MGDVVSFDDFKKSRSRSVRRPDCDDTSPFHVAGLETRDRLGIDARFLKGDLADVFGTTALRINCTPNGSQEKPIYLALPRDWCPSDDTVVVYGVAEIFEQSGRLIFKPSFVAVVDGRAESLAGVFRVQSYELPEFDDNLDKVSLRLADNRGHVETLTFRNNDFGQDAWEKLCLEGLKGKFIGWHNAPKGNASSITIASTIFRADALSKLHPRAEGG